MKMKIFISLNNLIFPMLNYNTDIAIGEVIKMHENARLFLELKIIIKKPSSIHYNNVFIE